MDILLFLYYAILVLVLVFPFYWIQKKKSIGNESEIETTGMAQRRRLLLENLKDLKTDMETGKLSKEELEQNSIEIIQELEEIDSKIS